MKFNPYATLLMTGALMFVTVAAFQTGPSVTLVRTGVASVDRDVSSFAAKTWTSLGGRTMDAAPSSERKPTRVASIDRPLQEGPTAD
jgi:hypothetical protein